MEVGLITYCCIDCGSKVSKRNALKKSGRCLSCAVKNAYTMGFE